MINPALPDIYFANSTPDARYHAGQLASYWRDLGVSDADQEWVNTLFSWCAWPYDMGHFFALQLRVAVLYELVYRQNPGHAIFKQGPDLAVHSVFASLADSNDTITWTGNPSRKYLQRAIETAYYIGFASSYVNSLIQTAQDILNTGVLPHEVYSWDCETDVDFEPIWIVRPLADGEEITEAQAEAIDGVLTGINETFTVEQYQADRAEAIAVVRSDLDSGIVKLGDTPELAEQVLFDRAEYDEAKAQADAELEQLESRKKEAESAYDSAVTDYVAAGGDTTQLAGFFSKTWKKVRKQVKRSWTDVVDEATRTRNTLARVTLPSAVREFGRDIEDEARRLGRRIDKQAQRSLRDAAPYTGWVKAFMPLIGFIPVVGQIGWIIGAGAVFAVEIAHTAYARHKLNGQLKEARQRLNFEIAELMKKVELLKAKTAELREQRAMVQFISDAERLRRLEFAEAFLSERQTRNLQFFGGALVTVAAMRFAGLKWYVQAAPLLGFSAWLAREYYQGPYASFRECESALTEGSDIDCRSAWIQRQLGPTPDFDSMTDDQIEALFDQYGGTHE